MNRQHLEQAYFELGNKLPTLYPGLSFRNHCYWRIALDITMGDQWNNKLESPAYKNLSSDQLSHVVNLLQSYQSDVKKLQQHNLESLTYRGKL